MTDQFDKELFTLLEKMKDAPTERHLLEPQLHQLLEKMRAAGATVPTRLIDLDRKLVDEGVEAQFDNLPI